MFLVSSVGDGLFETVSDGRERETGGVSLPGDLACGPCLSDCLCFDGSIVGLLDQEDIRATLVHVISVNGAGVHANADHGVRVCIELGVDLTPSLLSDLRLLPGMRALCAKIVNDLQLVMST